MIRRILQYAAIFTYLAITTCAFIYTMARIKIPGIAWLPVHWSYGMMAPYQGDDEWNTDFVARGRREGTWESIDIDRYIPTGFGERNTRKFLRVFHVGETDNRREAFSRLAAKLLVRERENGTHYEAVQILQQTWPRSPGGFDHLRRKPFMWEILFTEIH